MAQAAASTTDLDVLAGRGLQSTLSPRKQSLMSRPAGPAFGHRLQHEGCLVQELPQDRPPDGIHPPLALPQQDGLVQFTATTSICASCSRWLPTTSGAKGSLSARMVGDRQRSDRLSGFGDRVLPCSGCQAGSNCQPGLSVS